jgi:DNA-binding transcriptional MerR regulator
MRIGEVVSITGLTKDTIRFYEKTGLIKVKRSSSEWNNYKDYDINAIQHLNLIKEGKMLGFTLNEIKELLELIESNQATCKILSTKIQSKLGEIDQKITRLQNMKKIILERLCDIEKDCDSLNINCQSISKKKTA